MDGAGTQWWMAVGAATVLILWMAVVASTLLTMRLMVRPWTRKRIGLDAESIAVRRYALGELSREEMESVRSGGA